jgi:hypothetical protein
MKSIYRAAVVAVAMCASTSAFAQSACDALQKAIESEIKEAALSSANGLGDNSAPRATMRQIEIANNLSIIQANIALMAQNKCPPRTAPINPGVYLSEALSCSLAILKSEKDPPACDKSTWKGSAAQ